jgi:hypothetical protein
MDLARGGSLEEYIRKRKNENCPITDFEAS